MFRTLTVEFRQEGLDTEKKSPGIEYQCKQGHGGMHDEQEGI